MIKYVQGDLFADIDKLSKTKKVVIPHIVNNLGIMGSGFVVGLKNKYPRVEEQYVKWYGTYGLGLVQFVGASDTVLVANMFAQDGIGGMSKGDFSRVTKPIKYASLIRCMEEIKDLIDTYPSEYIIAAPKFGSLRSCGSWPFIEELIEEIWGDFSVTIYEYKEKFQ